LPVRHGKQAGLMSVADHNVAPGKKLWTWGNGPRGRMWDRILTDDDGPYIELMAGAYSDNHPTTPGSALRNQVVFDVLVSVPPDRRREEGQPRSAVNLDVKDGKATVGFCTPRHGRRKSQP